MSSSSRRPRGWIPPPLPSRRRWIPPLVVIIIATTAAGSLLLQIRFGARHAKHGVVRVSAKGCSVRRGVG
jgi:hypothetical protein